MRDRVGGLVRSLSAVGVAACQTTIPPDHPSRAGFVQMEGGPVAVAEDRPYLLERGDQIDVKLFLHPELNESVVIRSDGKISLQLVGEVNARGVTPGALTETLVTRYAEAGLLKPQVAVILRKA